MVNVTGNYTVGLAIRSNRTIVQQYEDCDCGA
jgi:hypothetical protein